MQQRSTEVNDLDFSFVCPDCNEEQQLPEDAEEGDIIECAECGAELDVLSLDPIEVEVFCDDDNDYED